MHVKLEVETQPLSNFVTKTRRFIKKVLFFAGAFLVNIAGVIFAFTWIPNHVHNADKALVISWMITVIWTGLIWINILNACLELSQEARWRSTE